MRKRLLVAWLCVNTLVTGSVYAANSIPQDSVITSFNPVLEKTALFFRENPKILTKVSPPGNPGQAAFSVTHFKLNRISHDIVTTNSIIKPYAGYIDVDTEIADNKPCGNQSFNSADKDGWSDVNEALKNADNSACFVIRTPQVGVVRQRFVFNYHNSTGKWALSEIVYQDGSINGRLMALMGVPSPWFPLMNEPQAVAYNKEWIRLLNDLLNK